MLLDKLVGSLQVASIIAAAGFAAFALFTEYKDDNGKITIPGRLAVLGIVLSALLSLGTQWGKDEIDRRKAIDQADREQDKQEAELGRYREQINHFVGLSTQQQQALVLAEGLHGRMLFSLDQQQAVLTGNRRLSSNMQTALSQQQELRAQALRTIEEIGRTRLRVDEGTTRTQEAMWNNANRIDPSGTQLVFGYVCPSSRGEAPPLFDSGAFVQIGLRRADAVDDSDFGEPIGFSPDFAPSSLVLTAFQSEASARRISFSGPNANDLARNATFSRFFSGRFDSVDHFRDPEAWRNAGIEVVIFARLALPEAALARRIRISDAKGALPRYSFPDEQLNDPRLRVSLLGGCSTNITVIVNGRTVLDQHPQILLISGWRNFEQPTLIVRSYPERISPDTFPYFSRELGDNAQIPVPSGRAPR